MKPEQRDAIKLAKAAYQLIANAKKLRFLKQYRVKQKDLNALGWAIRELDPHVKRWWKKSGGKV